jgi:hypothetical protein
MRATAAAAEWNRLANTSRPCPLCEQAGSKEGPFHVCTECPHIAATRNTSVADLPEFLYGLVIKARCTRIPTWDLDLAHLPADIAIEAAGVRDLARALNWSSTEGKFILMRILMVATWPARAAADGHELARLLGGLFDTVTAKSHRLRPLANHWARWAGKNCLRLHRAWNDAIANDGTGIHGTDDTIPEDLSVDDTGEDDYSDYDEYDDYDEL